MPSRQTRYDYLLDDLERAIAAVDAMATATASDLTVHEGAADPHPGYLTTAEGNAAYQPLDTQLTSLAGLSYGSNTLKVVRVNAGETGFELATISGGGGGSGNGYYPGGWG